MALQLLPTGEETRSRGQRESGRARPRRRTWKRESLGKKTHTVLSRRLLLSLQPPIELLLRALHLSLSLSRQESVSRSAFRTNPQTSESPCLSLSPCLSSQDERESLRPRKRDQMDCVSLDFLLSLDKVAFGKLSTTNRTLLPHPAFLPVYTQAGTQIPLFLSPQAQSLPLPFCRPPSSRTGRTRHEGERNRWLAMPYEEKQDNRFRSAKTTASSLTVLSLLIAQTREQSLASSLCSFSFSPCLSSPAVCHSPRLSGSPSSLLIGSSGVVFLLRDGR